MQKTNTMRALSQRKTPYAAYVFSDAIRLAGGAASICGCASRISSTSRARWWLKPIEPQRRKGAEDARRKKKAGILSGVRMLVTLPV